MPPATAKKPAASTLEDRVFESFGGASLDAEKHVIRDVKLIGFESLNGRTYPPAVLRGAVSLYEGAKVNVDHPADSPAAPRSVSDRIGLIKNARFVEGRGVVGDFHFNPKHKLAEQVSWDAANQPEAVGFSHNATLKLAAKPVNGKQVVEQIVRVRSVDLVADPATTKSLYESQDETANDPKEGSSVDLKTITLAELEAARPDLLEAVRGKAAETNELEELKTKLAATEAQLAKHARQAAITAELTEAKLDPANKTHVSDVFMGQLLATESVDQRKALIADRAAIVATTAKTEGTGKPAGQQPTSAGRGTDTTEQIDPDKLLKKLRSR